MAAAAIATGTATVAVGVEVGGAAAEATGPRLELPTWGEGATHPRPEGVSSASLHHGWARE